MSFVRFNLQRAFCAFCQDRIWGLGRQGFKCIQCKLLVHKKCHKVVRKPCLSLQQQQQQQQSSESQTIDRNGDQQLDPYPCGPATHLEDEITESPIIEEHSRDRKIISVNIFLVYALFIFHSHTKW